MKVGKITNSILKRSVFKLIRSSNRSLLENKPQIGTDFAIITLPENISAGQVMVQSMGYGANAVYSAVNNLAAAGAEAAAIQCCVVLSDKHREAKLKKIITALDEDCNELGLTYAGGHTQVTDEVTQPIISVTATGFAERDSCFSITNAKPGQDIIMTKWIGIGGIQQIIDLRRSELTSHFNEATVSRAYGARTDLSVKKEAQLAAQLGVSAMHDISQGGIFAALWDFAESANVGIDVDFRAISVCQEIIEICEFYDINPYILDSCGCLLMTSDCGYDIVEALNKAGIFAAVIGRTTAGSTKIIRNRDEIRYLDKPEPDEFLSLKFD